MSVLYRLTVTQPDGLQWSTYRGNPRTVALSRRKYLELGYVVVVEAANAETIPWAPLPKDRPE